MMKKLIFLVVITLWCTSITTNSAWVNNPFVPIHAQITDMVNAGNVIIAVAKYGRVFVSLNNGDTWTTIDNAFPVPSTSPTLTNIDANSLAIHKRYSDLHANGITIFASAGLAGIYKSVDKGLTWTSSTNNIPSTEDINFVYVFDHNIYASARGHGIYKSIDDGNTWVHIINNDVAGLPPNSTVNTMYWDGTNLWAGVYQYGVYKSIDMGNTWKYVNQGLVGYPNSNPTTFYKYGNSLMTGVTNLGVFSLNMSTDNETWDNSSGGLQANGNSLMDLTLVSNALAIAVSGTENIPGRGVYATTDGETWYPVNDGLEGAAVNVTSLLNLGDRVIAGTNGAGIYMTKSSDFEPIVSNGPNGTSTKLKGNFPNPFNPSTNINFHVAKTQKVQLNVYDITGRLVTQLVNDIVSPGNYSYRFDASNLSSGIYYYKMISDDAVQTKKMVLVK